MKHLLKSIFVSAILLLLTLNSSAQKKDYSIAGIGFYNLENLFDIHIDPDTNKILQDDFTPNGSKQWNAEKYQDKLGKMARVISELGTDVIPYGLAILGVSEIENKSVLDDLVKEEKIKDRNYQIVHYESPDKRGIDVGLLYNPKHFTVISSKSFTVPDTTFKTRDQLLVSGKLDGELVHVIVTHWPSRRGGEKRSAPRRAAAADLGRSIIDSLQKNDPNAKILYMGDLNDDPTDASVKKHLKTTSKKENAKKEMLYNPWESYYKKGIGTLAYRDAWNLFDQIIVSAPLAESDYSSFRFYKAIIHNKPYMKQKDGKYKGYPKRSYSGGTYVGGFSDHFPVYVFLIKEVSK